MKNILFFLTTLVFAVGALAGSEDHPVIPLANMVYKNGIKTGYVGETLVDLHRNQIHLKIWNDLCHVLTHTQDPNNCHNPPNLVIDYIVPILSHDSMECGTQTYLAEINKIQMGGNSIRLEIKDHTLWNCESLPPAAQVETNLDITNANQNYKINYLLQTISMP